MTQEPRREIDLSEFEALTAAREAGTLTRADEETARAAAIRRRFPSTANLRWDVAFRNDDDLFGRLLRDLLKQERAVPGRHGPRPGLDRVRDGPALDRMRGMDHSRHPYSLLPFAQAFALLIGTRSVRHAAHKLKLTPTRVYRLTHGLGLAPTAGEMESIAKAFDHHPSYFREYRQWAIVQAIAEVMDADPESSIGVYEGLWQAAARGELTEAAVHEGLWAAARGDVAEAAAED